MKIAYFIAERLFNTKSYKKSVSKPIVKIAGLGVCLSMLLIQLAMGIANGFKQEIETKLIGFQANYKVRRVDNQENSFAFFAINPKECKNIIAIDGVKAVSPSIELPAVMEAGENISGLLVKALDSTSVLKIVSPYLSTKIPSSVNKNFLFISEKLALKKDLAVGDRCTLFFFTESQQMKQRNFVLTGLFKSGIEDIDDKFAFCSLNEIQQVLKPGVQLTAQRTSTGLELNAFGESTDVYPQSIPFENLKTKTVYTATDLYGNTDSCVVTFVNDSISIVQGEGTHQAICSNYSVYTNKSTTTIKEALLKTVDFNLNVVSIDEENPEIYNWLTLIQFNVLTVIIILMVVAAVNMISSLLILIFEKTASIGLLKTIGASDGLLQQVFTVKTSKTLLIGIIAGNLLALALGFILQKTQLIPLDEEQYFVSFVPVSFNLLQIIISNAIIASISIALLWLPTYIIGKIRPGVSTKFQ